MIFNDNFIEIYFCNDIILWLNIIKKLTDWKIKTDQVEAYLKKYGHITINNK